MFDRISDGLWWDKAWSLVDGCTPVSPACDNCWAAAQTQMRANHPNEKVRGRAEGLTTNGHFNGRIRLNEEFLDKPLRAKKPTAWAIWNDLFHEDVPFDFITQAFDVMCSCSLEQIFIVLTKRPERIRPWMEWAMSNWFNDAPLSHGAAGGRLPDNVWLGVTAENQQTADERIPILLQIPAAVRFISVEPMLGPVDLIRAMDVAIEVDGEIETPAVGPMNNWLNWVICGGESGPNARPMHPDWVRSLRDQCQAAGVPFLFKSWGEWFPRDQWEHNPELILPDDEFAYHDSPKTHVFKDLNDLHPVHRVGKKAAGRLLDGREWLRLPRARQ